MNLLHETVAFLPLKTLSKLPKLFSTAAARSLPNSQPSNRPAPTVVAYAHWPASSSTSNRVPVALGVFIYSKENLNRFNSDAFQSTERPLKCKLIYYAVMIHRYMNHCQNIVILPSRHHLSLSITRRPASADRTARRQFQATGQPVSPTQASDTMTSRLPRYEAKCAQRRCFQCWSVA